MANLQTTLKASAIQIAARELTGISPEIEQYPDHVRLFWTPENQRAMQQYIENQLKPRPAGDVQIDVAPILLPLGVKKVLPYALGILAIGFIIGRVV
jgi:hypothetical protein